MVAREVEGGVLEDGNEIGKAIDHVLAFAELGVIVEVCDVDDATKVVGISKFADDLIDPVTDVSLALESN